MNKPWNAGKSILLKSVVPVVMLASFLLFCRQGQASPETRVVPVVNNTVNPGSSPQKRILFLSPYQSNLPVALIASQVIREEFGNVTNLKPDLYFEYLDLNRFPGDAYQHQLLGLLTAKYGQQSIDLVIVAFEEMLDFWLAHRGKLLPNTPVVFCDVNNKFVASRHLPPDVTGVSSSVDYMPSMNWVIRTRPSVKEIVIVHGVGKADKELLSPIAEMKVALGGRIRLTDLSNLSLIEIKRRVAALPQSSVVLYHTMFEDATGVRYRPFDVQRELAGVSAVPIISGYDHYIGAGTIGGYMYSVEQQTKEAVRIGLRILRGEPANLIPIITNHGNRFIFDHVALQRHGIRLSELPPESIVKNRQYTAWERYRLEIIAICVAFAALTLMVLILGIVTQRLNRTSGALRKLTTDLEAQVQERTAALTHTNRSLEDEIGERRKAQAEREKVIAELQGALSNIRQLEGILPICSHCRKIRDDDGNWQIIETYLGKHSRTLFSHGLCPECGKRNYPGYFPDQP